jgi:hypothetical protein
MRGATETSPGGVESIGCRQGVPPEVVSVVACRRDVGREMRQYRRACREIARLLDQGKLSEARGLNTQARRLFQRLYA